MNLAERADVAAVLVLVAGLVLAQFIARISGRGLTFLDQWLSQHATRGNTLLSPRAIRASRTVVFWLVLAATVLLALRILGVGGFSALLEDMVVIVPKLIIGIAIVGAGHLGGLLCAGLIVRLNERIHPGTLIPRLAHTSVLVVAVVMALQQLSVDITFLTQLLLVLLAIGTGGLALAFALGARQHVANLIARSELQRYTVGERIRVDAIEGTIVEIHATGLDLVTAEGVISIPAARFSEVPVLRLAEATDHE